MTAIDRASLPCPHCGSPSKTIETRSWPASGTPARNLALQVPYTRRRRECVSCGHRFTTAERVVDPALVSKGGKPMADAMTIRRVVRQSAPRSARQVLP